MLNSPLFVLVIVVFLALAVAPAPSASGETGKGSTPAAGDRAPEEVDKSLGLDDDVRHLAEPGGEFRRTAGREVASDFLAGLSAVRKGDAILSVEPVGRPARKSRAKMAGIETLWRAGRYDHALDGLRALERQGLIGGVGIGWRTPIPAAGPKAGDPDVRIGNRTGAQQVALDYDLPSGNLFALVDWGPSVGWSLNLSTDGGATWSETFFWLGDPDLMDLSVVDGFAYVGYTTLSSSSQARLRRHSAADGVSDGAFFFQVVHDASPLTIDEIALAANAEYLDNRIYCALILSDGTVKFFWDVASDGTTFSDFSPVAGNALRGLDMAFHIDFDAASAFQFLFLSYLGSDNSIYVYAQSDFGWDGGTPVADGQTFADKTSISAHSGTVIVSFEYDAGGGQGVQYRISYDSGGSWGVGLFGPEPGTGDFFDPLVTARSGSGTAIVYEQETGFTDTLLWRQRPGFSPGEWSETVAVNDFDLVTGLGDGFAFDWLGLGYGIAYYDNDGLAHFSWVERIFSDGFES